MNLENLEKFFRDDIYIKKAMYETAIKEQDGFNLSTRIKYGDNLYSLLNYIEDKFITISSNFNFKIEKQIKVKFKSYRKEFLKCRYDFNKMKQFYQKFISDMNPELISMVEKNCVGYKPIKETPLNLLNACNSINEILHVFHSYIINDEHTYEAMPMLSTKTNDNGYPINLYGNITQLSANLFTCFPNDIDCGNVEIIGLNNKVLCMVRDKGHALTIEIQELENDNIKINYFIPKLCNIEMINKLKGVRTVSENSNITDATMGMFITSKENLYIELYDFINTVPTDSDIIFNKSK